MSTVVMSSLKTSVQTILEQANTTSGYQIIDLSTSLTTRVRQVLQINPEKIPIQPSFFPCITMFFDKKQIQNQDLAGSARQGRRKAELNLKIVGFVWSDNMNTSNFALKDLADNECEQLMENIEQVLRHDPSLAGYANWSYPTECTYHNFPISEDAHMRAGVLEFKIVVFY